MKLLLVDDSLAIQESFGSLLEAAPGVRVIGYAEDVAGALAFIAANPPDLIVLDARLRGGELGIDLLRHVRQHHSNIEVVMLSQLNWTAVRRSHLEAGAMAYFDKGLEFQQARDFIADLANARSAAAAEREGRAESSE